MVDLHLSHVTSALIKSPILPPEERYVTFRSVDTPVAKSPREATAREPPRSTGWDCEILVFEWGFWEGRLTHASYCAAMEDIEAVLR